MSSDFDAEYKKLNKEQKEAVEALEGPVMVVAGPGTGKTQVLALRIANILKKTDIKADGVLALTFTNSAVDAMKARLARYIGEASEEVNVFTFHSFGMKVIEEHYKELGLKTKPRLLEDTDVAIFFDQILNSHSWEYLRPRADQARYFKDLRSLISLLKRELISKEEFSDEIEREIKRIENDENSISSRGESKGKLKKEAERDIEGLKRSREIIKFIEIYEDEKNKRNVFDYDDVLLRLVELVERSNDVVSEIRERYLYVLVDEHQDSSRVQNEFLKKVWSEVESPDIFVVGDDRQLIYGFSGASIDHFQGFKRTFKGAKLITLVNNYRSTQVILDASHALLESVMSDKKLVSAREESHPIRLIEAQNEREEITSCGMDIKEKKLDPNECAVLVPKNRQVRRALEILHELGLPVATLEALNLFEQEEVRVFMRVLKIINNGDRASLARSFFDSASGVSPLEAHQFFVGQNMREFSWDTLIEKTAPTLFSESKVEKWIEKLAKWKNEKEGKSLEETIKNIGKELFEDENERIVSGKDITNTILSLLARELEKNPGLTLFELIVYLEKLEQYGEPVPIVSALREGVKVLTMHSSKGLEFDWVWIAHMDERSLSGAKKIAFTLPESIKERIEERDIDAVKRKLYVAITRAKRYCTLSYSPESAKGGERELAKIITELPEEVFKKEKARAEHKEAKKEKDLSELKKLVAQKYTERYVSASMLNNFFECPRKWYFQNFLSIPEEPSESLVFGSKIHEAIDKILKEKKIILPEEKEVAKVVKSWAERRLSEIKPNFKNEQSVPLKDTELGLNIYGKIDLIENLSGSEVRVTDFKTGSVRKKSDIEKLDDDPAFGGARVRMSGNLRQLAMYSYLLAESPKWRVDVRESRLEFLEAKNPKEFFYDRVITNKEIEMLKQDIADYVKMARSGEWAERECNYNSYGKNTECEYCKLAEIFRS